MDESIAPSTAPDLPQGESDLSVADFAAILLRALVEMGMRSQRRQADLTAALTRANLPADPPRVRAALRLLQSRRCITGMVPLSDGGLLLTVTLQALQSGDLPQWMPFDDPGDPLTSDATRLETPARDDRSITESAAGNVHVRSGLDGRPMRAGLTLPSLGDYEADANLVHAISDNGADG